MTKQQLDDKVTFDGFSLGDLINFGNYILRIQSEADFKDGTKQVHPDRIKYEVEHSDVENWKESQVECSSGNCCKN